MSYFKALGFREEPFSTSPDPRFLYHSFAHRTALHRLEISLRLRRGLSLILGDVGTGKTTLGRALLQSFSPEEPFEFHLILNPHFKSDFEFLAALAKLFNLKNSFRSAMDYEDAIQNYLWQQGVEKGKIVVLMVDEGQKLTPSLLEILRTLLNYETNEYKLLQVVIMAQLEILPRLKRQPNFLDRVNLKYHINPFDEHETKEMILFRMQKAGIQPGAALFTEEAIKLIYEKTQGYPRKITQLCHSCLEYLVMQEKRLLDGALVQEIVNAELKL